MLRYTGGSDGYFRPLGKAGTNYTCFGAWSGHFLNWATMQGADIFRWALTGGNRSTDTPRSFTDGGSAQTILERAFAAAQGYFFYQFPDKYILARDIASYTNPSDYGVTGAIGWDTLLFIRNGGLGFQFGLKLGGLDDSCTGCKFLNVRVEVCRDPDGTGTLLEGNCKKIPERGGHQDLLQAGRPDPAVQGRDLLGAFGYLLLNDNNNNDADGTPNIYKDGGVLRAMVQSVEPEITETGAFVTDPYNMLAEQGVTYSGTINYLNKFSAEIQVVQAVGSGERALRRGDQVLQEPQADHVVCLRRERGESRRLPGVHNLERSGYRRQVPEEGPAVVQKNYIVGIGDTNSNFDFNLSGSPYGYPADVRFQHGLLQDGEGLDGRGRRPGRHARPERQDHLQRQLLHRRPGLLRPFERSAHRHRRHPDRLDTYWMDVMEVGYISKNQYWLATKYGGYKKPTKTTPPGPFDASKDTWVNRTTAGPPSAAATVTPCPTTTSPPIARTPWWRACAARFRASPRVRAPGRGRPCRVPQVSATSGGANTFQGSYHAASWSGEIVASKVNKILDRRLPRRDHPCGALRPRWTPRAAPGARS